jgi:ERCC4-type nuclease
MQAIPRNDARKHHPAQDDACSKVSQGIVVDTAVLAGGSNRMASPSEEERGNDLPSTLSAPARRALTGAGCTRLEDVAKLSEKELKQLHGVGPNAIEKLRQALRQTGRSFAGDRPAS